MYSYISFVYIKKSITAVGFLYPDILRPQVGFSRIGIGQDDD